MRTGAHTDRIPVLAVIIALALAFWVLGEGGAGRLAWYRLLGAAVLPLLSLRYAPPAARGARTIHVLSLLFVALAVLSLSASLNRGVSAGAVVTLAAAVALMLAASAVPRRTAVFLVAAQVVLVLPIAVSAMLEPFGGGWLQPHVYYPGRAMANQGGPGPLGALLAATLPLAVAFFLTASRRRVLLVSCIAIGFMIAAIAATFSRAALIASAAGLVAVVALLSRPAFNGGKTPAGRRVLQRALVVAVMLALIVPAYNLAVLEIAPPEYEVGARPGTQTFQLVREIEGTGVTNADVRRLCWGTALRVIGEHPATGVGAGCFGMASGRFGPDALRRVAAGRGFVYQFAYNDYLQFGAELGLPSVGVFVVLLAGVAASLRSFRRRASEDTSPAFSESAAVYGLAGALCALAAQAVVDFPLHLPTHATIFWIDVGLVLALTNSFRSSGPASPCEPPRPSRVSARRWSLVALALLASVAMASVAIRDLLAEKSARESIRRRDAGDWAGAVDAADRATELAPHEHTYWVLFGETELAAMESGGHGDVAAAVDAYRNAARAYPNHAPTHGRLGALLMSHAKAVPSAVDSAQVHLRRSIALNPYYADPHTNLGTLLMSKLDHEGARREYLLAAGIDSVSAAPLFNLGNLESELGRRTEAIARYRSALRRDPKHFGSLVNIGVLLMSAGDAAEAEEFLVRALRLEPESEHVQALLAEVHESQRRGAAGSAPGRGI